MLKKYAESFYQLGAAINILKTIASGQFAVNLDDAQIRAQVTRPELEELVVSSMRDHGLNIAQTLTPWLRERCEELDLHFSALELDRWPTKPEDFKQAIDVFDQRVRDELAQRFMFFVSPAKAKYYDDLYGGWEDVLLQIDIFTDVIEAKRCFALDRYSGCVYHLMRIAEIGVQTLATHLNLPEVNIQEPWGTILRNVQKVAEQMPKSTLEEKEKQRKVSEIATALWHVNLAWRIPAEHPRSPRDSYNEEQAAEAMGAVRALMTYIARLVISPVSE